MTEETAAEKVRMHILSLIASKPDAKINRSVLMQKLLTPSQKVKGQSVPNPCYSSEPSSSVIAALVAEGYLEEKIKFGTGNYCLLPAGRSELERLISKHGDSTAQEPPKKRRKESPVTQTPKEPKLDTYQQMKPEEEQQFLAQLGEHARELYLRQRDNSQPNPADENEGRKY